MLDPLGDVVGLRVLDAGCGPGLYAEEVVRRGAAVVGFDESPDMVRLDRLRLDRAHRRTGFIAFRLVKPT
jgi:2-polyprenyl-3-methyl-5-hydroxy-6-metoxy-1,4-benzoquinol methylase